MSLLNMMADRLTLREREALRRLNRPAGQTAMPDPRHLSSLIRLRLVDSNSGSCLPEVTPMGRDVLVAIDTAARANAGLARVV